MKEPVVYLSGGKELLDQVRPLWEKLNVYHRQHATHFADQFDRLTFDVRKQKFLSDEAIKVRVDLVKGKKDNECVGYCVSTISDGNMGEIDSLYVESEYRQYGIGDRLMRLSLSWFDEHQVQQRMIGVAEGNEGQFRFYDRYGFYPRKTMLEQIQVKSKT